MRYRLYAVLVHEGSSTASGHYYCYVRPALSANGNGNGAAAAGGGGGWHLLNDSHVRPVGESEVRHAIRRAIFRRAIFLTRRFFLSSSQVHGGAGGDELRCAPQPDGRTVAGRVDAAAALRP